MGVHSEKHAEGILPVTSSTYVYTYIAFALAYLVSSATLAVTAFRTSGGLSKAGRSADPQGRPALELAREYVGHGQRLVDLAQLATLLPLAYIVGSIFLGSAILRNQDWAGMANALWVAITVVAIGASVMLAAGGTKEARALSDIDAEQAIVGERTADAAHKLASRLGISTTLLVLVALFTMLNLWSVAGNLGTLLDLNYVL
jgi:hypothetical protein